MVGIIYSLPFNCPFPWQLNPSYPISISSSVSLESHYLDQLYSSKFTNQVTLDNFGRYLLQNKININFGSTLRQLILPIHTFDLKWRTVILDAIANSPVTAIAIPSISNKPNKDYKLSALEQLGLLTAHTKRLSQIQDVATANAKLKPKLESVSTTADPIAAIEAPKPIQWIMPDNKLQDWLTSLELLETQLQSLLLLTLISLSPIANTIISTTKPRRKKDPERHAATLDPELLLDFLTDRLQIWRLMKDVSGLRSGRNANSTGEIASGLERERDEVQEWWEDVVEVLYANHLPLTLLQHHRTKLFPTTSSTASLSSRLVPEPSPFKSRDRTLMSLDKSARRRGEAQAEKERGIMESPTMKRLAKGNSASMMLGMGLTGHGTEDKNDVFKMPSLRSRNSLTKDDVIVPVSTVASTSAILPAVASTKAPRKQLRPLPLTTASSVDLSTSSRPTSNVTTSKALFNNTRREVSLTRRPSLGPYTSGSSKLEHARGKSTVEDEEPKRKKRKSVSPRKTSIKQSKILVMATPSKSKTFSRAISLPSFASLGAAFRPGLSQNRMTGGEGMGFHIPPAPRLPGDVDSDGDDIHGREMDWEREREVSRTPKGKTKGGWTVPDTPG